MMKFDSELEMENFLFDNPDILNYDEGYDESFISRQLSFDSYGRCDLVKLDRMCGETSHYSCITVFELKNCNFVNMEMITQVCRYKTALTKHARNSYNGTKYSYEVHGCIILSSKPDLGQWVWLHDIEVRIGWMVFDVNGVRIKYLEEHTRSLDEKASVKSVGEWKRV